MQRLHTAASRPLQEGTSETATSPASAVYSAMSQRPQQRVRGPAVVLVVVGSAAVASVAVGLSDSLGGTTLPLALPIAATLSAVVAAAVLAVLARLTDDLRLGWMAWAYGVVAAVTLAGGAGLGQVVLPTFAVAALCWSSKRWLRSAVAGAFGVLLLVALLEPTVLEQPRWLLAGSAAWCVAGTVLWLVRSGRRPSLPELWLSVSLLLLSWSAVTRVVTDELFASLWWASHGLWAAHLVVPAVGLFVGLVHHVSALDRHDRALAARLNLELGDVLDGQAGVTLDRHDREQCFDRVQSLIDTQALSIVLQPIYNLRDGHLLGFEALSRIAGPPAQPPDVWFAEAASVGSGVDLELVAVAAALPRLADVPEDAYLAVNVSPDTLASPRLAALLSTVDVTRLVVEVTEHARIDDYEQITRAMDRLKRLGVRLAVDDAGAGFSSLRHIVRLGPAIIKLDISLTRGIDQDPIRRSLAASLVDFADTNGIALVAEGIETEDEFGQLRALGVTGGQGYLLCRPASFSTPEALARVGGDWGSPIRLMRKTTTSI